MIILGIDPGQSGGLALCKRTREGLGIIDAIPMPCRTIRDKTTLDGMAAEKFLGSHNVAIAVIEAVGAMPKQGVTSMFSFGRMLGGVDVFAELNSATQLYVPPRTWKTKMGLGDNKNTSVDTATRLFGQAAREAHWPPGPKGGKTAFEGVAEACLIALWYAMEN